MSSERILDAAAWSTVVLAVAATAAVLWTDTLALPYAVVGVVAFLAGCVTFVWGYGVARQAPVVLWVPPVGLRHAASLLTLVSFVLLAATYVPANALKARLKHPMVLGIKLWALAHLLSNGNLADVLLFGSFLLWAILSFRAARLRDAAAVVKAEITHSPASRTILTLVLGVVAWAAFAIWAHGPLIGVRPFGG